MKIFRCCIAIGQRLCTACFFCLAMLAGLSFYSLVKPFRKAVTITVPTANLSLSVPPLFDDMKTKPEGKSSTDTRIEKGSQKDNEAKPTKAQWNKLITVTNSNYGIGFLGGIKDLSVIVTNRTDCALDEVIAKVTYLKASGGVWKTVPVTICRIPPHETKEQSVPDVNRGKKVKVSLQKVVSKKLNISYNAG